MTQQLISQLAAALGVFVIAFGVYALIKSKFWQ
jgi:hypothetical protein